MSAVLSCTAARCAQVPTTAATPVAVTFVEDVLSDPRAWNTYWLFSIFR